MEVKWPTDKDASVRRLKEEGYKVQPGQKFEARRMEPGDAWGVARCFFEVYGENYPFDTYYVPEKLISECERRNMIGVVACTTSGDIVGFGAIFRGSALNPRLYEYGQGTVIPDYRFTFAFLCIQHQILKVVVPGENIDGVYGEAVCNHIISQKMAAMEGFIDTGIEIGLMPAETYRKDTAVSGRVSAVLTFGIVRDEPCDIHIPQEYGKVLETIVSDVGILRNIRVSDAPIPADLRSTIVTQVFNHAQVVRMAIPVLGEDFKQCLISEEEHSTSHGILVYQVFVNLGEPWSGRAIPFLRQRGYFFGGFLPGWFGTDGLLMQKLAALPDFGSIELYSERSREILEAIRQDIGSNPACGAL